MALMKDQKPTKYAGEQRVWEKLHQNLPDDIVCYNHRELNGREFDFCLLIPEIGFLILEVKGWVARDIVKVNSPSEIILRDTEEPVGSPKMQARGYRFDLLNKLQENYHLDPPVMDMVCYPFLSQTDYDHTGLSVVSEPEFTIFAEDLESENALSRKISRTYFSMYHAASDACTGKTYDTCRKFFEKDYVVQPPMQTAVPYSCLSAFTTPLTLANIKTITDSYFSGTKQILFVQNISDLQMLADNLTGLLREKNIMTVRGGLQFGSQQEPLRVTNNRLSLFHFEAICIGADVFPDSFTVYDGAMNEAQKQIMDHLPQKSCFNLAQYLVEHAPIGRDIQVRAGAGTGKTYSMVSRIAFLCHPASNSGIYAPAEEIAMLTFTADAAVNMKNRLKRMFMNYFVLTNDTRYLNLVSDVEKMRISTIHSFAGDVFKGTALALGIGTNFSTISGYYERNILFDRYFDEYLVQKNQESPLFFEELPMSIYEFQRYLRQISGMLYNKGCDIKKLPMSAFGTPPEAMPYLQEIIEKVIIPTEQEYDRTLAENNALHLSEYMIYLRKCIAFEGFNTNLFHYKYVFIDEFQDTDDAQIAAFLAMQEKIHFNFFIVGDLKQSIYRFRGATMDAFRRMGTESESWIEYSLTINYRTDARLLDQFDLPFSSMGAKSLLPYIPEKDRLTGATQNDKITDNDLIVCIPYVSAEVTSGAYYDKLFEEITKQKAAIEQRMQTEKLSAAERTIAILTRTNSQIETIMREARKREQQIESSSGGDLYQLQSTLDLCKLTSALCHPYHYTYLYALIRSNNVGVVLDPRAFLELDDSDKTQLCVRCLDEFYKATLKKSWSDIIYEAQHEPVLKVLHSIYEGTEPWKRYSKGYVQQDHYRANYDLLFEELSQSNKKNYLTLDSVNEALFICITTGAEREPRNPELEQDGVRILCTTVHKSKVLEYGTVVLPFTDRDNGSSQRNGIEVTFVEDRVGYCITVGEDQYANSFFDAETEGRETLMEEARILYVAMTRAINRFVWCRKEPTSNWSWGGLLEELYHD